MYRLTSPLARVGPSAFRCTLRNTPVRFTSSSSNSNRPSWTKTTNPPPQGLDTRLEAYVTDAVEVNDEDTSRDEAGYEVEEEMDDEFPDLMTPDPLMDLHEVEVVPPKGGRKRGGKVVVRNEASIFDAYREVASFTKPAFDSEEVDEEEDDENSSTSRYLGTDEIRNLHRYPILTRYVTQQTGKGKVSRSAYLVIVGNGDGLVGIGEAKGHDRTEVVKKATENAVRNMDLVERFEQRTLWTEMEGKLGATKIILRPRPVGFGLAVNPYIHQVFKAAGIKDASAKVWGSRNPYQVIRLLAQMLHPGAAPAHMGNGIGGSARRLESGRGMRGKDDIERERGRKLVNLYTR